MRQDIRHSDIKPGDCMLQIELIFPKISEEGYHSLLTSQEILYQQLEEISRNSHFPFSCTISVVKVMNDEEYLHKEEK